MLGSDAETGNFTNFGSLHIGKNGMLFINTTLPEEITLSNESRGNLIIDNGGILNGGTLDDYSLQTLLKSSGTLNNSGKVENFSYIYNSGILNNEGSFESHYHDYKYWNNEQQY